MLDSSISSGRRRRTRTFVTLSLAVIGAGAVMSSALFTDSTNVGSNSFTNGTVVISTDPATTALTASNMAPGDNVYGTVKVSNLGTLPMRYSITSNATNTDSKALASQLQMTVKSGVSTCDAAGFAGGSTLYNAAALGGLGTSLNILGDPSTGQQTGDRSLAAAANETLCFRVTLPTSTSNAYQGATTTATLTFAAEQTTNNP
ncbi:MAG: hypothetical protein EBU85_02780 [Actinobacteria bacterium]|nr:hypothetical protein [Actinomycetota bacterium]